MNPKLRVISVVTMYSTPVVSIQGWIAKKCKNVFFKIHKNSNDICNRLNTKIKESRIILSTILYCDEHINFSGDRLENIAINLSVFHFFTCNEAHSKSFKDKK